MTCGSVQLNLGGKRQIYRWWHLVLRSQRCCRGLEEACVFQAAHRLEKRRCQWRVRAVISLALEHLLTQLEIEFGLPGQLGEQR